MISKVDPTFEPFDFILSWSKLEPLD